jgi:hypothetical protein
MGDVLLGEEFISDRIMCYSATNSLLLTESGCARPTLYMTDGTLERSSCSDGSLTRSFFSKHITRMERSCTSAAKKLLKQQQNQVLLLPCAAWKGALGGRRSFKAALHRIVGAWHFSSDRGTSEFGEALKTQFVRRTQAFLDTRG